jgi:transcriptional regulator with XRE-family HTH domain
MSLIGARIKSFRKKCHLTQNQLAEKIGVSEITLRRWENTETNPDGEALLKLAQALDTSVSYLINEQTEGVNSKPYSVNVTTGDQSMSIGQFHGSGNHLSYSQPILPPIFQLQDVEPITELAKLGQDVLRVAEKLTTILVGIFKVPYNGVAPFVLDWWRLRRLTNTLNIAERAMSLLRERNILVEEAKPLLLKIGIPILDSGGMEEEQLLQDLWVNLLTNSIDPKFEKNSIRTAYIDIIKGLSSLDVRAIQLLRKLTETGTEYQFPLNAASCFFQNFKHELDPDAERIDISVENLLRLRIISVTKIIPIINPDAITEIDGGNCFGENSNIGIDIQKIQPGLAPTSPYFTPMGLDFLHACMN